MDRTQAMEEHPGGHDDRGPDDPDVAEEHGGERCGGDQCGEHGGVKPPVEAVHGAELRGVGVVAVAAWDRASSAAGRDAADAPDPDSEVRLTHRCGRHEAAGLSPAVL
ncbi:MAG: hypothetical protein ACRDZ0_01335 [Acidimicrobiales bacterium]